MELAYERSLRNWMAARGMQWTRRTYPRATGGEVVCYRLSPQNTARGVVMPVHGAGNDALFSLPGLIKRLLRAGFEVFSFDLDGHGRGSTTRLDPARLGGALPEAVRESGAAGRRLPLHGIGVSLGGALLLHAMAHAPQAFASASVLVAPFRIRLSRRAVLGELRFSALRAVWREREHCGVWGAVPSFGPVKRGVYPLRLAVPAPPGPFGYVEVLNAALAELGLPEAAQRVRTPTLLAYGTADRIVPSEQGEVLHRAIAGSELLRLGGGTHLTTPLAPEVVSRALEWVESPRGGPQRQEEVLP